MMTCCPLCSLPDRTRCHDLHGSSHHLIFSVFLMHLGSAAATLRASILEAGIFPEAAQRAVEAFEAGAREEWLRIGGSTRSATWGTA